MIPHCSPEEAEQRAEKLCSAIHAIDVKKRPIDILTASIGVALFPEHGESTKELFAHAETAKQVAKQGKRGLWKLYSEEQMGKQLAAHRVYWKTQVDQALAENRIMVFYQPIMRVSDNHISHYECLVRMESPVGKIINPSQFVEVAESSDQVHQIRDRVMRRAARYMRRHRKKVSDISIAINLSGNTFSDESFIGSVEDIIESSGMDPRSLIFEVTETAAVENMDDARRTLNQIKQMGCRIALDDFGVGFTSFEYLKQLPVDYVKLDQSFVRQLTTSAADQTLVRSMIRMVQGLGKRTVAEGVEDYEQLEWLRQNHIDYVQGYLLGEPKPDMLEVSDTPNPLAGNVSVPTARSA